MNFKVSSETKVFFSVPPLERASLPEMMCVNTLTFIAESVNALCAQ